MRAFRALLRRTPVYGLYKRLGHYPDYWYWQLRGRPIRSPHLLKQQTVQRYAAEYRLRVLVETGTYYGEMVAAMRHRLDRIYSIEYDPALAERAARRFARWPHITILAGDSQRRLPEILASLSEPALFWLDAGYYGWAETQGDRQRLSTELEAILRHPVKGHVILLDDARGLNGENGAPTVAELQRRIETGFPERRMTVEHDIVRIT